jgi:hypothetical protein
MEVKNSHIDAVSVEHATDTAKMISEGGIQHALEFMADFNKEKRLKKRECKTCFYFRSGRIGGAAMTTVKCGVCEEDMMFGSTCIDKLCGKCSDENELCVFCGGDIKMRIRRHYTPKVI